MTTVKNKTVRWILFSALSLMILVFQGCGGGSGGGSGTPDENQGGSNLGGPNGTDNLVGIGESASYDCTNSVLGPAYSLTSDSGVHFKRSYVHANHCAIISEKVVVNSPVLTDLNVQIAVYNPLNPSSVVSLQSVKIFAGQTESQDISVDMDDHSGAHLLTMQVVSTDSSTIKVGKNSNLNVYRFTSTTSPVKYVQVSSGLKHTCAIRQDGKALCWGDNTEGQLGTGVFLSRDTPTVISSLSDVKQIIAGETHTCAIVGSSRNVFCWGKNSIGQLGAVAGASVSTPLQVPGLSDIIQIELSRYTTCALRADFKMSCWGSNIFGVFADGSTTSTHVPTESPHLSDIKQISIGLMHGCAALNSGALKCWGTNDKGQLGDGSTNNSLVPVDVLNLTQTLQVSAGAESTCALNSQKELKCWGFNGSGELGTGNKINLSTPTTINLVDIEQIAFGGSYSCALQSTGKVFCAGSNSNGQIGNGNSSSLTAEDVLLHVEVVGLTSVESLGLLNTGRHTCALLSNKSISCWGENLTSQHGTGSTIKSNLPLTISDFQNSVQMASGRSHACAIKSDSTVSCLGRNDSQQLGDSSFLQTNLPLSVLGLSNVTQLALGSSHTCALLSDKTVMCWGGNSSGQLGNGTNTASLSPVGVSGLTNVRQIVAGSNYTCAVLENNTGYCWGGNSSGQLGNGSTTASNSPIQISNLTTIQRLSTSLTLDNTCALLTDKTVSCWGFNSHGHMGTGNTQHVKTPFALSGFTGIDQVQIGFISICGLKSTGSIICQGLGTQLGNGSSAGIITTPVNVTGITTATKLSIGASCAILANQTVKCWGRNANLLVTGAEGDLSSPITVDALFGAQEILNSGETMYAKFQDGTVSSWGLNDFGQTKRLILNSLVRYLSL